MKLAPALLTFVLAACTIGVSAQNTAPIPLRLGDTLLSTKSQASWPVRLGTDAAGNNYVGLMENWNGQGGRDLAVRFVRLDPAGTAYRFADIVVDIPSDGFYDIAVRPDGTAFMLANSQIYRIDAGGSSAAPFAAVELDEPRALTLDGSGALYAAGHKNSDAAYTKIDPAGGTVYTKTLLGSGIDIANDIAVANGKVFTVGRTGSGDFQTVAGVQPTFGGAADGFVAAFDAATGTLVASTYYGGAGFDELLVVRAGAAAVAVGGTTDSDDVALVAPLQPGRGGGLDGLVAKLNPALAGVLYSSYLGGSAEDQVTGLHFAAGGKLTVAGVTFSNDFPLYRSADTTRSGNWQAFLGRVSASNVYDFLTYQVGGANNFDWGFDVLDRGFAGSFLAINSNNYQGGGSSSVRLRRFSPYQTIPLFDTTKPFRPDPDIDVQVQDLDGVNCSGPGLAVSAVALTTRGATEPLAVLSADFSYNKNLKFGGSAKGGYRYTLNRNGLPAGDYDLHYRVAGESAVRVAAFSLK